MSYEQSALEKSLVTREKAKYEKGEEEVRKDNIQHPSQIPHNSLRTLPRREMSSLPMLTLPHHGP